MIEVPGASHELFIVSIWASMEKHIRDRAVHTAHELGFLAVSRSTDEALRLALGEAMVCFPNAAIDPHDPNHDVLPVSSSDQGIANRIMFGWKTGQSVGFIVSQRW